MKVAFKKDLKEHLDNYHDTGVYAVLLDELSPNSLNYMSTYHELDYHSEAHEDYVKSCRYAEEIEIAEILYRMKQRGYENIEVVNKINYKKAYHTRLKNYHDKYAY